jgi:competence protein ComEC
MITPDGNLHVYMVNVGQGDTTIIVTPQGNVVVVDVMRPAKVVRLLQDLNHAAGDPIAHLILTHPHTDHFGGGNRLASDFRIVQATVAPFWHTFGMGPPTYQRLIGRFFDDNTNVTFLSGYSRWYPDGAMSAPAAGAHPQVDPNAPFLELLGPTNGLIRTLEAARVFNANHLSIMLRVRWRNFRMIIGGDAQMENWAHFDHERMMEDKCQVLRAAHHGSSNGTQWERIDRLGPTQVIVSSDPGRGHRLPDLTSAAVFLRFDSGPQRMAVTTIDSGTIHLKVASNGSRTLRRFRDAPGANVNLNGGVALTKRSNPTDWAALLQQRIAEM